MNWKDIATDIGKIAPTLGLALGGPAGAAVGAIVSSALGTPNDPAAVQAALGNPDTLVKLKQIESEQAIGLQQLVVQAEQNRLAADTQSLQAVNASIQAEAKADHWPTYTWRPMIGFAVAFILVASSVLVLGVFAAQVLGAKEASLAVSQLPSVLTSLSALSATALPILGIASWYRGKMQADPNIPTDNRG